MQKDTKCRKPVVETWLGSDCSVLPCPGYVCVAIGTSFLTVAGVAIYVFRDSLGYLFVSSAKVAAMVATICPIAALYQFPDGILGTIGGILRCGNAVGAVQCD